MENSKTMQQDYPTRPQARNCVFFVITGTCRFGQYCKFNHPVQKDATVEDDHQEEGNQNVYLKSTRNIPCKFFNAGFCKYGPYCRFSHSSLVPVPDPSLQFNSLGLPMRVGVPTCSYYMSFGTCGYGARCKFHHPELREIGTQEYGDYACAEAEYPYGSTAGGFTHYFYHDD